MRIVNSDNAKEEFEEGKLWNSIYYPAREAHYNETDAVDLADEVKQKVMEWIHNHEDNVLTTKELREKVEEVLEEIDEDVALLYHTHLDLG